MVFKDKKSLKALVGLTHGEVPLVEQRDQLMQAAELRLAEVRELFESAVFDQNPPKIELDPLLLAKIAGDVAWLMRVLRLPAKEQKGWFNR